MKRIIRLTESDLALIVRRVMNEESTGARQTAPILPQLGINRLVYERGVYKIKLWGNPEGTEPGYFKAGEQINLNFILGRTSDTAGIFNPTFTFLDKTMTAVVNTPTVQALGPRELSEVKAKRVYGDYTFKAMTGYDYPAYGQQMSITFTLPQNKQYANGQAVTDTKIGTMNLGGTQVMVIDPKTGSRVQLIDIYMPANSIWGVGAKSAAPTKTTTTAKKS